MCKNRGESKGHFAETQNRRLAAGQCDYLFTFWIVAADR
jgi:hypothetical protein